MGGTVGGVNFQFDLYWLTQFQTTNVPLADSDARPKKNLDGEDVYCYVGNPQVNQQGAISGVEIKEQHVFKFSFATPANLAALRSLKDAGTLFDITEGTGGETLQNCRFVEVADWISYTPAVIKEDEFSFASTTGTQLQYVNGQIRVYINKVT
jgi:hypothetical protein